MANVIGKSTVTKGNLKCHLCGRNERLTWSASNKVICAGGCKLTRWERLRRWISRP